MNVFLFAIRPLFYPKKNLKNVLKIDFGQFHIRYFVYPYKHDHNILWLVQKSDERHYSSARVRSTVFLSLKS